MGAIDGFLFSPVWGGSESRAQALKECIREMNSVQTAGIVDKFVADHPERWHLTMQALVYQALFEFCPAIGTE